jgi:hypothetical protein
MRSIDTPPQTISVFVPIGHAPATQSRAVNRSPRDGSSPLVIGLLDNHKHNTAKVLDRLEHRLQQRYEGIRVIRAQKPEAGKGAPQEMLESLASDCQAVINGIGD